MTLTDDPSGSPTFPALPDICRVCVRVKADRDTVCHVSSVCIAYRLTLSFGFGKQDHTPYASPDH